MNKPNIVYLMFDQAKASAMSFMGNTEIEMPYCDSLAQKGWVFESAYAAAPICTPSRASVHTGMFPQVHQVTCHQNRAPYNLPQLAEILQDAGYYTAAAGHYEPERNLCRGWHEQSPMHERGPLFESWMAHIRSGRKDVSWSSGAIDVEAKDGNSALLTDRCLRMLDQAENTGKPFFLHMCYDDPHPPYFVPRPYDTMFDPDELTLPETGDLQNLPAWHAIARDQAGIDKATDSDKRKALAIYYGMIRYIDDEMARIHAALEEKGLLENTWIILGSDHGDYTGEKGFFNKSESHYKCLLHVPLIIVPPKDSDEPNPRRIDDLVSCVDIFPTILKMAGVEAPTNQGRDILEWVRKGHTEPLRDVVFAQIGDYHGYIKTSWPSGMPEAGRHKSLTHSIRTSTRVYIQDPDNGDEAYDLRDDPNELHNLTNDITDPFPDLRQQLEQFTIECAALREKLDVVPGDRGFVEGWE
ncbi:MAG: sulfatase-like hydrolase/transferase [Paracoccaceae bacterium]|nr:sulfatase-like hydrolase/transferase [Paracoccaceae bacterium]MDG2258491.1 sulfatase-like hydrolase/transferase [Paracoccaceae bacterium]